MDDESNESLHWFCRLMIFVCVRACVLECACVHTIDCECGWMFAFLGYVNLTPQIIFIYTVFFFFFLRFTFFLEMRQVWEYETRKVDVLKCCYFKFSISLFAIFISRSVDCIAVTGFLSLPFSPSISFSFFFFFFFSVSIFGQFNVIILYIHIHIHIQSYNPL